MPEPKPGGLRGCTVALTNSSSGERAAASFIEEQLREELGDAYVLNLMDYVKHRVDPTDGKVKLRAEFANAAADWEGAAQDPRMAQLFDLLKDTPCGGNCIVAGGDGTIAWGMQLLDKHFDKKPYESRPFVAIIPMGTGNDLSRSLGFGPGFVRENFCCCCPKESIRHILAEVEDAHRSLLDRWEVKVRNAEGDEIPVGQDVMSNYLSVGLDAQIAHNFDTFRRENPGWCKSRALNKIWYAKYGATSMCGSPVMKNRVKISVDGTAVPAEKFAGLKNIILTNIDSFGAGMKVWRHTPTKKEWTVQSFSDGKVELCGYFGSWHMLFAQGGMRHSKKVSQGSEITIELLPDHNLKMQVDGEPSALPTGTCTIHIRHHPAGAHKVLTKRHEHRVLHFPKWPGRGDKEGSEQEEERETPPQEAAGTGGGAEPAGVAAEMREEEMSSVN